MAFGLDFFTVAPGLRVAGDSVAYAYKFTGKGGQLNGLEGLEIGLVDDPTIKLIEGAVSGYEQVADRDVAYDLLVTGGLTELVPGLAIGIDSLSSIETGSSAVRLAVAGSQPVLVFRKANVQDVTKVGDGGYTWDLPTATFDTLKAAAESYQSDLATKVEQMIAARISADGVLQAAIDSQAVSDATARGVIQADVDANQTASEAADAALSDRLDVLEADPTSATAVAAGDAATLSSANTYTDTSVAAEALARSNADTTLQGNIDTEAGTRASADSALDGRLDTLEADPVTKTYVDTADGLKLDASAVSAYGLTLVDDADAATARTTLGLGTAATTDSSAYATAAQGALADTAVQPAAISNVDNTSDADKPVSTATQTALDLKADLAGATFSGDVTIDEGTGSTIKLETSDATSAGIHIEGPTGSMGYIDTTNGFGNDSLQVYSANFWVRAINNGTGNVIIDGQLTAGGLVNAANDGDAATAGVPLNGLYHHNGDMKIRLV